MESRPYEIGEATKKIVACRSYRSETDVNLVSKIEECPHETASGLRSASA